MLRQYVEDNLKTWNKNFRTFEFAHKSARPSPEVKSPFSLVYGRNPDSLNHSSLVPLNHKFTIIWPLEISLSCLGWRKRVLILCSGTTTQVSKWMQEVSWFEAWKLCPSSTKANEKESNAWIMLDLGFSSRIKWRPVTYRLKLPPGSRMYAVVYVGMLWPYHACDA